MIQTDEWIELERFAHFHVEQGAEKTVFSIYRASDFWSSYRRKAQRPSPALLFFLLFFLRPNWSRPRLPPVAFFLPLLPFFSAASISFLPLVPLLGFHEGIFFFTSPQCSWLIAYELHRRFISFSSGCARFDSF